MLRRNHRAWRIRTVGSPPPPRAPPTVPWMCTNKAEESDGVRLVSRMGFISQVAYDEESAFQRLQGFVPQMLIQTLDGKEVNVRVKLVGKQVVLS